jgi:hypothetical protein
MDKVGRPKRRGTNRAVRIRCTISAFEKWGPDAVTGYGYRPEAAQPRRAKSVDRVFQHNAAPDDTGEQSNQSRIHSIKEGSLPSPGVIRLFRAVFLHAFEVGVQQFLPFFRIFLQPGFLG